MPEMHAEEGLQNVAPALVYKGKDGKEAIAFLTR